uniref:DUF1758 domain-containing protein n=1 Tax=Glossina brevipalpis TaxID=37001 RepID=A0A1A9WAW1_9MUSC
MFFQDSFRNYQNLQNDVANPYRCELCSSPIDNGCNKCDFEHELCFLKTPPGHTRSEKNCQEARNPFNPIPINRLRSLQQQRQEQKKQTYVRCKLCGEEHRLAVCKKYRSCNLKEKYEIVGRYKYCENCLDFTHLVDECLIKNQCVICRNKHHTTLHGHPFLMQNVDGNLSDSSTRIRGAACLCDIPTRFSKDITYLTQTLLPTVWLSVMCFGNTYRRRALISPSIPITQVAVTDVRLNEWDWITQNGKSYCSINICPIKGPYIKIPVMANITSKLPRKIYPYDLNPQIERSFPELTLADPFPTSSREITIELGADIYSRIVKSDNEKKRFGRRYIVAQNTIFGWTLCGRIS